MVYTTATLIEAEIRATTSFATDTNPTLSTINTWIEESTDYINSRVGMSFESTATTDYIDYKGIDLFLKKSPIISVTSLKYNTAAEGSTKVWATKTEDTDFIVYEEEARIKLVYSNFSPIAGAKNIEVIYNAGYSTAPSRVQMLATKLVSQRVIESLLYDNVNSRNDGGSISVGSINIVEPGNYGVGTFKQLKSDISIMFDELTNYDFQVHRYG